MTTVTVVMMYLMILRKIGRPFEIKADLSNTSGQSKTVISESKYIMCFFYYVDPQLLISIITYKNSFKHCMM